MNDSVYLPQPPDDDWQKPDGQESQPDEISEHETWSHSSLESLESLEGVDYFHPSDEGIQEPNKVSPQGIPWERRREIGFVEAFFDTCRMVLFQPKRFFQSLSPQSGVGDSFLFVLTFFILLTIFSFPASLIMAYLNQLMGFSPEEFQSLLQHPALPPELGGALAPFLAQSMHWTHILAQQVCCSLVSPFGWMLWLFILSFVYSAIGLLYPEKLDFDLIFKVLVFSEVARATYIINPIPMLRDLVFLLYWLILATLGFSQAAGMSVLRSLLFVILPAVLFILACCLCCSCGFGFSTLIPFLSAR